MITNIKCLGSLLFPIVYALLSLTLCECKPNFGMNVLGNVDNAISDNDKISDAVDSALTHEEDPEASKRGWSNFNSWGKKRGWNKNFAVWGKRRWNNFAAWGKRSPEDEYLSQSFAQAHPERRAWSRFNSWGKRSDGENSDDNIDKRRWSSFQAWGKRSQEDFPDKINIDKKWSQFAAWGKRDDDRLVSPDKRKWAQFNAWGKRSDINNEQPDKRKWSQFSVWGKRDLDNEESDQILPLNQLGNEDGNAVDMSAEKRKWSRFATWGKRLRNARKWAALNTWGKRRWSGLPAWGKRSAETEVLNTEDIAHMILAYFDVNGDQALDLSELNAYIDALVSLPSNQETEVDEKGNQQM